MPESGQKQYVIKSADVDTAKSPDHRTVYVDTMRIGSTLFDFRLVFGALTETEPNVPLVEEQVTLVMSPQHAKAVLAILASNIVAWERQHGVINTGPGEEEAEQTPMVGTPELTTENQ
jgi:hypothetical protein